MAISVPPGATSRPTLTMAWPRYGSGRACTVMISTTRSNAASHCAGGSSRSAVPYCTVRSEEHTSELQSRRDLVCRLLLEKKKKKKKKNIKHNKKKKNK